MEEKKYPVYRNDIKYKKHRNIDVNRAVWDDNVKNDFMNKDTDSIDYRIEECQREKYTMIDLSNMDENCLELLLKDKRINAFINTLEHIFVSNSCLNEVPDLSIFTKLKTLDISHNKITKINELPSSLEEFIANDNKLTVIKNDLPNLKRMDVGNNNITYINYGKNMESLNIHTNPIEYITEMKYLYFLNIQNTKINNIPTYPRLKEFDCSYTNIEMIPKMPLLEILTCGHSDVKTIDEMPMLEFLEMINTNVKQINYMNKLKRLVMNKHEGMNISTKYKIQRIKKNKNDIIEILFLVNQ
jgi:hypothetical protein